MASGLLPKSPVSLSLWDEVPHIFIPKSHLEPREFLISSAKRLLQQYRHIADKRTAPCFVAYWTNNGQRWISARVGYDVKTQLRHWLCTAAVVLMPVSA